LTAALAGLLAGATKIPFSLAEMHNQPYLLIDENADSITYKIQFGLTEP
jgi:hypothetical protein